MSFHPELLISFTRNDRYATARTITRNKMNSLFRQNGSFWRIRAEIAMRYWDMTSLYGDCVRRNCGTVNYFITFILDRQHIKHI